MSKCYAKKDMTSEEWEELKYGTFLPFEFDFLESLKIYGML